MGRGFYLLDRNLRRCAALLPRIFGGGARARARRGLRVELLLLRSGGHGHANAHPRSRTRAWLQQQSSARAHPSTRIFPKKYDMNTHDSAWLRMDRAWSTMGALHRPPQSQDHAHAHVEDHAHIRARTRIRTRTHRTASAPRSISICEKVSRPR